MKRSEMVAAAAGAAVTVVLGITLLAAVAYEGPGTQPPQTIERRGEGPRRVRERERTPPDERPAREQRTALQPTGGDCSRSSAGLTPLTELGDGTYKGVEGGLYSGGANSTPPQHQAIGRALAERIEPLDADGDPDPDGRYVLLSIGMSNTQMEFAEFKQATESDPARDPHLVVVNGAQGGVVANEWSDPTYRAWEIVDSQLDSAGVTREQVAVAWVKVSDQIKARSEPPTWPEQPEDLRDHMASIARILADRFPNLRLAYYSSRIYGGYGFDNTEPFAYQSGFSVKWLVDDQIQGAPELNFDASAGPVEAPWLAWGPYLWADGVEPRRDGLTWECSDFRFDGTHPTEDGVEKVTEMLLDFFHTNPTAVEWYLQDG